MESQSLPQHLSHGQKTGFVLLLVFTLVVISLAALQMRNTIYGPFVRRSSENSQLASLLVDDDTRLQQIDTDRDGLNDYEELYFYETSPYLPDTDSDGIDDKTEVAQGENPNCAKGKKCDVDAELAATVSTTIGSTLNSSVATPAEILVGSQALLPQGSNTSSTFDIAALINNPTQLRQLLVSTGQISAEELSGVDDATLKAMAQNLLVGQLGTTNSSTSSPQSIQ